MCPGCISDTGGRALDPQEAGTEVNVTFSQSTDLAKTQPRVQNQKDMPKSETTKLLVEQAVAQLRATSAALAALKHEMQTLASQLPEYPVVMDMFGVGPTLGPQLIAEIGDVRRFYSKKALVAYAGLDAPPNDSGDMTGRHKSMSKVGASSLRRTLFLVMSVYLQNAPLAEPVYQFMDKKRAEGKPYRVYMMASANKFLRIYYATVKAYLESLELTA